MSEYRILAGVRPTGMLHLGNYWGAIKQFIDYQDRADTQRFYFIADLHSLTTASKMDVKSASRDVARGFLACGLDPKKSIIYRQSDIRAIPYLTLLLGMLTSESWLRKCTTYKEKSAKQQTTSLGLLGYPVLMTADILTMQANLIPVGHDQLQHIEMARDIAAKFNHNFSPTFVLPDADKLKAIRIMGLSGKGKMGKSDGNYVGLFEDEAVIKQKILSATTDSGPVDGEMPDIMKNIYFLLKLHAPEDVYQKYLELYNQKNQKFYRQLKEDLARYVLEYLSPIRSKYQQFKDDEIEDILADGAKTASPIAEETLADVMRKLQL